VTRPGTNEYFDDAIKKLRVRDDQPLVFLLSAFPPLLILRLTLAPTVVKVRSRSTKSSSWHPQRGQYRASCAETRDRSLQSPPSCPTDSICGKEAVEVGCCGEEIDCGRALGVLFTLVFGIVIDQAVLGSHFDRGVFGGMPRERSNGSGRRWK